MTKQLAVVVLLQSISARVILVYALSFTDGVSSREAHADRTTSKDRVKASEMAAELLGFSWISRGEYPDNMLDTIPVLDLAKI